jgi:hypothetical protein
MRLPEQRHDLRETPGQPTHLYVTCVHSDAEKATTDEHLHTQLSFHDLQSNLTSNIRKDLRVDISVPIYTYHSMGNREGSTKPALPTDDV